METASAELASQIQAEISQLQIFAEAHHFRDFWAKAREIQALFGGRLSREDRERLWSEYQRIYAEVQEGKRLWDESAKENAAKLRSAIEALRNEHLPNFLDPNPRVGPGFWLAAGEISAMFRELKPLLKPDREQLWSAFNNARDEANRHKGAATRDSATKRRYIEQMLKQAALVRHATSAEQVREAGEIVGQAYRAMQPGWDAFEGWGFDLFHGPGILIKDDRDYCFDRWVEVKKMVQTRRVHLQELDYAIGMSDANAALNSATYGDPYEAQEEIKYCRAKLRDLYLAKDQRAIIRNRLDDAWNRASSRISEIKSAKQQKRQEWVESMHERVDRWQNLIEKNEGVIQRLLDQIEECEGMRDSAVTDEFADTVQRWIDEKQEKIDDIRRTNAELKGKIADAKQRLND